jgi:ATP-binding cassette subfamily F protein 3
MLTVHHLTKSFDNQRIFDNVTFSLDPGERMGLVGPNGCGKTTLLRILAGQENPDSGHVRHPNDLRLGYLPQGFELDPSATLGEIIGQAAGDADVLEGEVAAAAMSLAHDPDNPRLQHAYDDLLHLLEFTESGRVETILAGLGLQDLNPGRPVRLLSGGQGTRLALALVLLNDPQLLLLDEPTNHLDIAMLEWLEGWIAASSYAALIVSHDRTFLDRTVTRILEMDPQRGVHEYGGNYTAYLEQRQAEIDRQWADYKDQQAEIKRMQQDIARVKSQAEYTERQASSIRIGGSDMKMKGFKSYQQGIAKKVAKKAKAREKKLDRFLESGERVEKPQRAWQMRLEFNEAAHISRRAIALDYLSVGYSPAAPLLRELELEVRAGQRIVLTGPNGSGKTTLLRTIAGHIPPLAGNMRLGPSTRLGYMTQDQSSLDPLRTPVETVESWFPNETQARTFLSYFLFTGDEPLKPNALLSYGQRSRLMLALLVAGGCNCLLLDEPINHLDIPSRAQFERSLAGFEGAILAVVHDRYFIERFADEVWWVEAGGIRRQHQR